MDIPKSWKKKTDAKFKKAEGGEVRWYRDNDDLLTLQWKDKKVVTMLSSYHSEEKYNYVQRQVKNKEEKWEKTTVPRPEVVKDYYAHMGGVNLSDQYTNKYNKLHRVNHWWLMLFFHFVDVAIVKSYILFQEWRKQNRQNPDLKSNVHYG